MPSHTPDPATLASARRFFAFLTCTLVVAILWIGKAVIAPVMLAALSAFLLSPAVGRLMHWGLGKVTAIAAIMTTGFALLGLLGWMVTLQVFDLAEELPAYERNIQAKIASFKASETPPAFRRTAEMIQKLQKEFAEDRETADYSDTAANKVEPVPVRVAEDEPTPLAFLNALSDSVLPVVVSGSIVLILLVAMLLDREDLRDRFIKVVSAGELNLATQALEDASRRVSRYLLMQLLVNASYGIPIGLGLYLIGIPNAPLWGLMATLLRFIPFLGPWIAAIFPTILAFAVDPGWNMFLATLALFVVMEIVSNNIIEVWLYRTGTGISNLALLVAAIFWTTLWGPIGLVLSTPVTVCLLVLGKYMPGMRFLSTLLGSEPVLDPPAQFYQRMLAQDSDEMLQLATEHLENHSLAAFYDDVFLPALSLAERDRHRGTLAEVRQRFIFTASRELIEELERRSPPPPDRESPDTSSASASDRPSVSIWCLPATDDADEIVGLMAGHLLATEGFRTVVAPVAELPDEQTSRLAVESASIAFVSALPPSAIGSTRRACLRVNQARPDLPLIAGIWDHRIDLDEIKRRLAPARPASVVHTLSELVAEVARQAAARPDAQDRTAASPGDNRTETRDLLRLANTEPEGWIDQVVRAAAQLFEIPVSFVFMIPVDASFWPQRLGFERTNETLPEGLLKELNHADELTVIDDVVKEGSLAKKDLVRERGVRRLLNLPLRDETGRLVGHLCLMDTKEGETTDSQRESLLRFGHELTRAVQTLDAQAAARS